MNKLRLRRIPGDGRERVSHVTLTANYGEWSGCGGRGIDGKTAGGVESSALGTPERSECGVWRVMERIFVVVRSRGPAWDDSEPLERQTDWAGHAAFMDALFQERFAALVGPLEGTRDALLVLRAASASEIVERLALDPWTVSGLLVTTQISPWQLRLGSLS